MKKGQLQIQETSLVIFIVIIIMLVGLGFFWQYQAAAIGNINNQYQEDKFFGLISYLPSMPELRYTRGGIFEEESIDFLKAKSFSQVSDSGYYKSLFGFKKITLDVSGEELVLYDRRLPTSNEARKINSPISIYDPRDGRYYVGLLEVEMYA